MNATSKVAMLLGSALVDLIMPLFSVVVKTHRFINFLANCFILIFLTVKSIYSSLSFVLSEGESPCHQFIKLYYTSFFLLFLKSVLMVN